MLCRKLFSQLLFNISIAKMDLIRTYGSDDSFSSSSELENEFSEQIRGDSAFSTDVEIVRNFENIDVEPLSFSTYKENIISEKKNKKTKNKIKENKKSRQISKYLGKPYTTASGKKKAGRVLNFSKACKNKCINLISRDELIPVFKSYWKLNRASKISFLCPLIEVNSVKRRRPRKNVVSHNNRTFTAKYFLSSESRKVQVCKTCFLVAFDETYDFIRNICKKNSNQMDYLLNLI